jgi:hypothetical protein
MLLIADARTVVDGEESDLLERRRGLRIRQSRPIKIFEPCVARYFPGQTQDISSTGLRVELPLSTPLRPGKMLNVHVGLNDSGQSLANRRQMIPARVIWIDRDSRQSLNRLVAGVEFLATVAAQVDAA